MDRDALVAVAEDLEYLAKWGGDIPDDEIRRGSAVLRRLLIEDAYGHAWRAIGFTQQPSLIAVDLMMFIGDQLGRVQLAFAGGAQFKGFFYFTVVQSKGGMATDNMDTPAIRENGYPCDQHYDLSKYLASPSGVVNGDTFNRREVIKYVANVKGGVHLSVKERKQEEKLIVRMGKIEKKLSIQNSDALLIEILAIGQALGLSADAKKYIARIRESS